MTNSALEAVSAAVATACGVREPRRPSGSIDWTEFLRLVDRHRVAPLVQRSGWLAEVDAPAATRTALGERTRRDTLRTLSLLSVQREALAALTGAGVDAVVIKGIAVALEAYGDPTARAPGDLDLLVRQRDVQQGVRALTSVGFAWRGLYRPKDPERAPIDPAAIERLESHPMLRHVILVRDGIELELHWRLFEDRRLMPVDPEWLGAPRQLADQDLALPTLPLEAHWLYVAVHGASHVWSTMKRVADVAALALHHPELTERRALEAIPGEYRRPLAAALLVAEATFGRFLAVESRDWAGGTRGTAVLVRRSLSALAADRDRPDRVLPRALPGEVVGRLALRPDARYRLEELRLLLLSAGRAEGLENPGIADIVAGPFRWIGRSMRRGLRTRG